MLCYSRRQQNIHCRFKDDRAELTCSDCAISFAPSAPIWLPAQVSVCVRRPMAATARIRRATHHNAHSAFAQTRAFIMHSGISCVMTTIYTPCASCSSLTPPRHPEAFNVWRPPAATGGLHTVAQRPPRRLRSTTNASLLKHSVYYLLAARPLMCHMHMQQNAPPIGRGPQVILPDNHACPNTTCTFGNAIQSTQAWGGSALRHLWSHSRRMLLKIGRCQPHVILFNLRAYLSVWSWFSTGIAFAVPHSTPTSTGVNKTKMLP